MTPAELGEIDRTWIGELGEVRRKRELVAEIRKRYKRWDILDAIDGGESTLLDKKQAVYTNWREFARRVCAPIVERADDVPHEIVDLLRGESAYYMVTALYMADRALLRCEQGDEDERTG